METISKESLSPKVFGYVPDDNPPVDAAILICGIGGNLSLPNGLFPFPVPYLFPTGIPAIVFAAMLGILLNVIFLIFKTPAVRGGETAQ